MISSNKIESKAITTIRSIVDKIPNAEHDINEKDKKIVLDGQILFFKNENTNKKENFSFNVNVQIKGRVNTARNIKSQRSYTLDLADLEFMLKTDGALLLVVNMWQGKEIVQYASLLPYELREYIKDAAQKGNKRKNIQLEEMTLHREPMELKHICEIFNANRKLQKTASELAFNKRKLDQNKEYVFLAESENPILEIESRLQKEKFYYNVDREGCVRQVIKCRLKSITAEGFGSGISDLERTELRPVRIHASQEEEVLLLGESFRINVKTNSFEYCIHGGLDEQIKETRFLEKLVSPNKFLIGNKEIEIQFTDEEKAAVRERLILLNTLKESLKRLGIKKSPNLDLWNPQKTTEVVGILESISRNEKVNISIEKPTYGTFNFYDLKLALFYVPSKDGKGNFTAINQILEGDVVFTTSNAEGYSTNNPIFTLKSNIYQSDNIDLKAVERLIAQKEYKEDDCGLLNLQALELIKSYDESCEEIYLDMAEKVLSLCLKLNSEEKQAVTINRLQIKKRKMQLSLEDIGVIVAIESSTVDPYVKICCEILLNKGKEARLELEKIKDNEAKKYFLSQPIMRLLKNLPKKG